jgi:hypothetical protein
MNASKKINPGDIYYLVKPMADHFKIEELFCEDDEDAKTANEYNLFCYKEKYDALCIAENLTTNLKETRTMVLSSK